MGDRFQPLSVDVIANDDDDDVDDDDGDGCTKRPPRSIDDYLDHAYRRGDGVGPLSFGPPCPMPSFPPNTLRRMMRDARERWRYHVIFLALGIANSGDSAEIACTSYALSSYTFQRDILVGDFATRGSAIAGAHFAGMFLSGLLAGPLADARGRRSLILLGLASNSVAGVLSSCASTASQLFALRFATGIGLGMVIGGVVALAAELSPPASRGRYMTLVSSCWSLGFLYTSFWALLIFRGEGGERDGGGGGGGGGGDGGGSGNWRFFMFMNALPTMVATILVAAFVPESPRFYLCRGRLAEAVHVSNTIAAAMGHGRVDGRDYDDDARTAGDPLTEGELRRYLREAGTVVEAARRDDRFWSGEVRTGIASFGRVFANGYWRTTVPLQLCYFALTLVTGVGTWWTKIFQNLDLHTDAYALSFYHTLAQIPGMMLATCLIDTVGRRRLIIAGFGGGSFTLILLSAMASAANDAGSRSPATVLALACSYTVCLCVCWLALDCISAESFPTRVRGTGRGVCVATGRAAGFFVQFLYGPLVNGNGLCRMMGLASAFAFCGMVIASSTTDTTNVGLRDHWDYSSSTTAESSSIGGLTISRSEGDGASIDRLDRNEADEDIDLEKLKPEFSYPSERDRAEPAMIWHSHERDPLLSKRRHAAAEGE